MFLYLVGVCVLCLVCVAVRSLFGRCFVCVGVLCSGFLCLCGCSEFWSFGCVAGLRRCN